MVDADQQCALSYYYLYRAIQANDNNQTTYNQEERRYLAPNVDDDGTTNINDLANEISKQQQQFWEEDNWTTDDIERVNAILQQSISKCRIDTSNNKHRRRRPTHTNINNDDDKSNNADHKEDAIMWDQFYTNHQNNFFKDRHYLENDFPNEFGYNADTSSSSSYHSLIEVGCGVGNTILPLLDNNSDDNNNKKQKRWHNVYGLDFSSVAVEILKKDERYRQSNKCLVGVCDISIPNSIPIQFQNVATVATLFFCLSAIDPTKHIIAVQNTIRTLQRPTDGGIILFRDYGRYDEAQIKLAQQRKRLLSLPAKNDSTIDTNQDHYTNSQTEYSHFYMKQDGTKCYYFTVEDLIQLFHNQCQLEVLECKYIQRKYINRSTATFRRRIWVQGRFRCKSLP